MIVITYPISNVFAEDIVSPISGEEAEIQIRIPDLKFPINRNNLIRYVEDIKNKNEGEFPLNLTFLFIGKLIDDEYNKTYKNVEELQGDLQRIITTDKELIIALKKLTPLKIVGCQIITFKKPIDFGKIPT
jgi:hypothetical protein